MGETVIDVPGRRIVVRVPDSENLAYLNLTSLKLGPDGITTLSPDVKPGRINLVRPLEIDVTVRGRTERWTVYVEKVDFVVNTVSADAWSKVVWVYGESQEGLKQGFQYRQAGSEEWIDVPESSVVSDGTSFSAYIPRLEPLTEYVVRAVAGEDFGSEIHVTTQSTELIPNGSFDQWSLNGKVWQPWNEGGLQFRDTGNKRGATMAGNSIPFRLIIRPDGKGKSADWRLFFCKCVQHRKDCCRQYIHRDVSSYFRHQRCACFRTAVESASDASAWLFPVSGQGHKQVRYRPWVSRRPSGFLPHICGSCRLDGSL